jgi:phage/conjugal plasmid C-4 type zinc finger TraR family protein
MTMADDADRAQIQIERVAAENLAQRVRFEGVSATHCADCGVPIPEVRRASLPGVQLCVNCQEINELEALHQSRRVSF